jgi:type I restriction enzyme S subunit
MTRELTDYATLDSGYPLLTSSRSGLLFQNEFRDNASTDNNETLFSIVPFGKCTYRHMSDDNIFHFNINTITEKGLVSREYPVFDSNENCNLSFLIQYLNSAPEFTKFCMQRKLGGTRTRLYYKNMCEFKLYAPGKNEQDKIGGFFNSLDHLITLHQQKCDQTKKLKKYMLQKMFPQDGQNVPEIRFAGYTDAWEQRKFKEVFKSLQNNTLSRAELNYESGEVKNVHYGDVLIKFGDYVDVSKDELPYISDGQIAGKYRESLLQDGDIIIADTAEDSTVGKCAEIVGSDGVSVVSGLHTIPCRPIVKTAPKFMGYYLNSSAYHNQLIPLMQGIKVTSISKSALQDTDIMMPCEYDEQAKIGEYFSSLDRLITLHQRKCEELKKCKSYMLQNMFV